MGCRILEDRESGQAVFYCSTTGWAFGPLFGSREAAEKFLDVCPYDPRELTETDLINRVSDFTNNYVCECGEVRGELDAEAYATRIYPNEHECICQNNGDYCFWCQAVQDYADWEPEPGERFVCWHCLKKAAEKEVHHV